MPSHSLRRCHRKTSSVVGRFQLIADSALCYTPPLGLPSSACGTHLPSRYASMTDKRQKLLRPRLAGKGNCGGFIAILAYRPERDSPTRRGINDIRKSRSSPAARIRPIRFTSSSKEFNALALLRITPGCSEIEGCESGAGVTSEDSARHAVLAVGTWTAFSTPIKRYQRESFCPQAMMT